MKHNINIHSPTFATNTALDMKLVLVLSIIAYGYADKLDKGYLPPVNAASSGGSPGALSAPADQSEIFGQGLPVSESQPGSYNQEIEQEVQEVQERPQAAADRNADTLKYNNENNGDSYAYNYETSNGITVEESAVAINGVNAQGGYAYTGDDGKSYSVSYTADVNGYQPLGEHIPTPHPIPEEILKSIEENAKAAAAGIQEGAYIPEEYESGAYYQSNPGQKSDGSLDLIENPKRQEINKDYNNPLASVGQQYEIGSSPNVNQLNQKQGEESGQDINQSYRLSPYQSQQSSESNGIQGQNGIESRNQLPIQEVSGQLIQGDGYQYNEPKPTIQPSFSGKDLLGQYRPQIISISEKSSGSSISSPPISAYNDNQANNKPASGIRPSNDDLQQYPVDQEIVSRNGPFNQNGQINIQNNDGPFSNQGQKNEVNRVFGQDNLNPSFENAPLIDVMQQYPSSQQTVPGSKLSVQSGSVGSQDKEGFFPNEGQQIQNEGPSGDLIQSNGNGYHYDQLNPAFQPANSKQNSFNQYQPEVSDQNEKISLSKPSSSSSVFNGDQNLKPEVGSGPSSGHSLQYQSGQQILPAFRPSSYSGPNASNKEGSSPNEGQQIPNKGNGYHYDQPKPAFEPANSKQNSFNQYQPEVFDQNEKVSSSKPSSSSSVFNGDQNLKSEIGSGLLSGQSPQYQSGQQILPAFRPSSYIGPNASNKEGSSPNEGQQIQNKGNGYHYEQPKPAFQPANFKQNPENQYRPEVVGQNKKVSSSKPSSSSSVFDGDQNSKSAFGSGPLSGQSPQYQSEQQILPAFRPSSYSGPNASNKEGSSPNEGQQIPNKGNGYHYDQPKPAFEPANSKQNSFNQYQPEVFDQNEKVSSSKPSSSSSVFNGDQNLKSEIGSGLLSGQSPQYQSGQQILPAFRPSSYSGPNASNKKGSSPNEGQQIQNKGNGYHYDQPKPAFEPANSKQNSFNQYQPEVFDQNEKVSSSKPSSSSSVFNGDQNLKPEVGSGPSSGHSLQYQSGQQILPAFRPSSYSGPNASNKEGSSPNEGQQIQNKGNGYHYDQPKPAFEPANSKQNSFNQYQPEVFDQNEKVSSSKPSSSSSVFNGDQNLKSEIGSGLLSGQSPQYQSGQQILPAFRPSSYSGPNASNKEGSSPNEGQQISNKGNGYHYDQPKPAFEPTNSKQNSFNQYRPEVSDQNEKVSSSKPSSSSSVFNGDQNLKSEIGSGLLSGQSPQYQSGQQILPDFRPSSYSGQNASNKKGSSPNEGLQIQNERPSGDLIHNNGKGYHYDQPKPEFNPTVPEQGSFNQNLPNAFSQGGKISLSSRPSSSASVINVNQNLIPSFGFRPSSSQSQQYPLGPQIVSGNGAFAQSGPNVSQNKEGSFPNQSQQLNSKDYIQNKGNGNIYNQNKPSKTCHKRPKPNGSQNKGSFPNQDVQNPSRQSFGSPQISGLNKNNGAVNNRAGSPFKFNQRPNKISQYQQIKNKASSGSNQSGQESQSSPGSERLGINKFGQGSVSVSKLIEAPYQYDKPSISFSTQRPKSFSQAPQIYRGNQDKSEEFGGPRQPPSYSPEEGYKY